MRSVRACLVVPLLTLVGLAACTDDGDTSASPDGSTPIETTLVTFGPPLSGPPPTYLVPEIPQESVAEICAGADDVVSVDDEISALLTPILALDASPEADAQLIGALSGLRPLVERAAAGYDRMAAVFSPELAGYANTVRDATLTFYGAVTSSQSMEGLMATVTQARAFSEAAAEAAARLDATTRKVCNKSLYNS